ncbi:hypothetical protein SH203_00016 [Brevundimonas sp. SH203]|uniref:hypothetical protein n=1 Tax=Brevundimonas sp. SH203 TaxID=345167 RepID=UPI0009CF3ED7|nr:hypothetical protein [Brevundimonas sp. SH203]GAW39641.1 hypothetical protein SH203_00016 [Brevundimonas sp. SH203]
MEAQWIDPNTDSIPDAYRTGAWRGEADGPPVEKQWGAIEGQYFDLFEGEAESDSADLDTG